MGNKTFLPDQGTPEYDDLVRDYPTASQERLEEWARQFGYTNKSVFQTQLGKRFGLRRAVVRPERGESGNLSALEDKVLKMVKGGGISVSEISRRIDRSSETVVKLIDALRSKNHEVILDEERHQVYIPQVPSKVFEPTEFNYFRKFYRIGIVSDTQICSKYQQMTLLHDAYADLDKRKVDFILHPGDLVDGINMYRGQHNEIFKHGADEQRKYVVDNYPKSTRGTKTYVIGGQHDFSFYKQNGHDILKGICQDRKDLIYRGFWDASFNVKGLLVKMNHPGGGVAYARSYKLQKYIENMIGYITSIPSAKAPILQLFGHWHIPCHLPQYMGIDAASMPCFQSQTPYLAEKGLMPVVGYAVAEIYLGEGGRLASTKIDFINMNAQIKSADF